MAVFHKDPCGVICLLMTYSAVLYADYCLVQHVIIPTLTDRLVFELFTAFKGETFHGLSISNVIKPLEKFYPVFYKDDRAEMYEDVLLNQKINPLSGA